MNEKKTVLFLMNGFGVETAKSFEVYSKDLMPTFSKLITAYPFKLLQASGEFIGNNAGEASNFKDGYYNFSTFGNPTTKDEILKKKFEKDEFLNNEIVIKSIETAVNNKSRLHVMFSLGDRVNKKRYEEFMKYVELAQGKGITEIYVHLILGDSSLSDLKIGNKCITEFKNRVIRFYPILKIASICGSKYVKDGDHNDIANFYKMMVSGVGEVWTDYAGTIKKKYDQGMTDDSINGFVTIRENLLRSGDSLFMFTYGNNVGTKFLTTVLNPKKFFPTSNVPEGIYVSSLFSVTGLPEVPYAFSDEYPENYFLEQIPEDKKILIMADKERIPYITKTLNGGRKEFKSNLSVWPIEDKSKRFDIISQYLAAYINQSSYDLILVDCQLYEPKSDARSIEQLKNNLKAIDKCINIAYNQIMNKGYRLMVSSLYGIRYTFKLTDTMELVDMSQKTPFLLIDKEIRVVDIVFKANGTFIDVSKLIAKSFGAPAPMKNGLVVLPDDEGTKKGSKNKLILIVGVIAALAVIAYLYFSLGII